MRRGSVIGLILAVFWTLASVSPADTIKGFTSHWYLDPDTGVNLPFRLFTPPGYDTNPDREYPLILFLHGAGESGTNNTSQINNNINNLIAHANRDQYAAFILAPQTNSGWLTYGDDLSPASSATMAVVDLVQDYFRIDPRRLYVTGLSMGGGGTWDLIGKRPNYFAAAIPICGYGDASKAVNMVDQPIWAFHAANDGTVSVEYTREMVNAVRAAGGDPLYTEYATGGHGIWGTVYAADAHYDWMFSQVLPVPIPEPAAMGLVLSGLLAMLQGRGGRRSRRRRDSRRRRRGHVEPLEDRRMLTAYLVDSLDDTVLDDGLTTLREALLAANTNMELWGGAVPAGSDVEPDTIEFDPALFTDGANPVLGIVVLSPGDGPLTISDPAGVHIQGPGGELLAVDAGHASRILVVDGGAQASLSDLALVNGAAPDMGGGIYNAGMLSLARATISGNRTTGLELSFGGAIYSEGDLAINDSIISGNSAGGGQYGLGGAVANGGTLSIVGSTISGNSAVGSEYGVGGAIYSYGDLSISDSTISDNSADGNYLAYGGGVYSSGTISVVDSTLARNSAAATQYYGQGGAIFGDGAISIVGSTVADNFVAGYYNANGGGICVFGTLTLADSTFSGNTATSSVSSTSSDYGAYGGGVYGDGTLVITGSTLSGNSTTASGNAYGGGISGYGVLSIADSTISGNATIAASYARGGGVHNMGTLSLARSTVADNEATSSSSYGFGGGIHNENTLVIVESTISGNSVTNTTTSSSGFSGGGGICNYRGTTEVVQSVVSGNSTSGNSCLGGGIHVVAGAVTVDHSTLSDNHGYLGGAAYNNDTLVLRDSTIADNSAYGAGGLCNYRDLTIISCTLSGNQSTSSVAGAIATAVRGLPSKLTMVNSTVSGNSAAAGSAIYAAGSGSTVSVANSTITANVSALGNGAIFISGAAVTLHNTVVAENASGNGAQVTGNLSSSSSYNLIGVSTGLSGIVDGVGGNRIGAADSPIDPLLGPLDDNGGPTWTHAPLPGSPLVDAGNDGRAVDAQGMTLRMDQRGWLRRFGTVDIGAVEVQPPGLPLANGDGCVVDQGESIVIDVLANDFCTTGDTLDVQIVEEPSHGTLQANLDGTLTYTPDAAFWGVDAFSYRAANGALVSSAVAVVVSVISPDSILVTTADDEIDGDWSPGDISLREALQMAAPGSVIQFSADLLGQTIRLSHPDGGLKITNVQIVGLGAEYLTIDGLNRCRVIEADGESLVSHVAVTGGSNSGIYVAGDARLTVANCDVFGNKSYGGAGIYNNGGTVDIVDSRIANNAVNEHAFVGGGGILNRGTMTVTRTLVANNSARTATTGVYPGNRGGGILNEGTLILVDSTVSGNSAGYAGGGVSNYGGVLTVSHCEFLGNSADYYGGALEHGSTRGAVVNDSLFSGNAAVASGGGAIATSGGPMAVTQSTFVGNSTTGSSANGGALYCTSGVVAIVNSAFSGNTTARFGGAIYVASAQAALIVRDSTIAGNTASRGGGLANAAESVVVNSILALNTAATDPNFYGTLHADSGFNLIDVDPLFVRNPGSGDPVGDLRPRRGSPAINAGDNTRAVGADGSPLLVDLGGEPRIVYATVDIGAYEYRMAADANLDGTVDTADAKSIASNWGKHGMTWADGDFNGDGVVNAVDAAILAANFGATIGLLSEMQPAELPPSVEPVVIEATPIVGPLSARSGSSAGQPIQFVERLGGIETQEGEQFGSRLVARRRACVPRSPDVASSAVLDAVFAEEYGSAYEQLGFMNRHGAWANLVARRREV